MGDRFPQLDRNQVANVLGHLLPELRPDRDANWRMVCPFHDKAARDSFAVNVEKNGRYHCFTCPAKGDIYDLAIARNKAKDKKEALDYVRELANLPSPDRPVPAPRATDKFEGWERVTLPPDRLPEVASDNFKHYKRGLPEKGAPYRDFLDANGNILRREIRYADPAADKKDEQGRVIKPGKVYLPWTIWQKPDGQLVWRNKDVDPPRPLYGLDRLAARPDAPVLVAEGPKTADAAALLFPDHVAISWPGGAEATRRADWRPLKGRKVTFWPDFDEPDEKKDHPEGVGVTAARTAADLALKAGAAEVRIVQVIPGLPWGWDLADMEKDTTPKWMTPVLARDSVAEAWVWSGKAKAGGEPEHGHVGVRQMEELEPAPKGDRSKKGKGKKSKGGGDFESRTCGQIVRDALYTDDWIAVDGELHYWTGTFYQHSPRSAELKRIAQFLDTYEVDTEDGVKHPLAEASAVHAAYAWLVQLFTVPAAKVNAGGINCTNGFLRIDFKGGVPSWDLEPHDPAEHFFTYPPEGAFDPDASAEHCDRMLAVLDAEQREIFLRTAAASFNLPAVREKVGRGVRAVLALGEGSNGKDTLREALTQLLGAQCVTGCSMSDFRQADQGRKFGIAKLRFSKVNWCSENASVGKLEGLKTLMAAITGENIDIELKGKDSYEVAARGIFIFNLNEAPDLTGALKAVQSRYAILNFNKVFSDRPDPAKGELQADPRLKYSPDFRREYVLPAFLNALLGALTRLMKDGIDYSSVEGNLDELRRQRNHLYDFASSAGLGIARGAVTRVGWLWDFLRNWYVLNGHATIEQTSPKEKLSWLEARKGDPYVKAANQIPARFMEMFPGVKHGRDNQGAYLLNFGKSDAVASPSDAGSQMRHQSKKASVVASTGSSDAVTQYDLYPTHAGGNGLEVDDEEGIYMHTYTQDMGNPASLRHQDAGNKVSTGVSAQQISVTFASHGDALASPDLEEGDA